MQPLYLDPYKRLLLATNCEHAALGKALVPQLFRPERRAALFIWAHASLPAFRDQHPRLDFLLLISATSSTLMKLMWAAIDETASSWLCVPWFSSTKNSFLTQLCFAAFKLIYSVFLIAPQKPAPTGCPFCMKRQRKFTASRPIKISLKRPGCPL